MKKIFQWSAIGLLSISLAACSETDTEVETTSKEQGDEQVSEQNLVNIVDLPVEFLAGNFEAIYNQTSDAFQEMVKLEEFAALGEVFNQGVTNYELVSQIPIHGMTEYQWVSDTGDKGIRSSVSEKQIIEGIQLLPVSSYPESDQQYTENTYQMPINEEWFVFWGGTNELLNYHYAYENQRYAYDLLVMENGISFEENPTKNESYYAFGKEVLAPLDGKVVSVENGIEDNTPNVETNANQPLGNHVIIEHANNEYSVIAHFQKGSVKVKEGDVVKSGDFLGLAGNSGNSSEPHIHFHVSDQLDWENGTSKRIKFANDIDPIRGDEISGF